MTDIDVPKISVEEMQRRMATELSLRARLGYTALLVAALTVAGATASLWLTEPSLPARAQIAFALIVGIGLSWVAYAIWVLTRRRVLLAGPRVIAARMAVIFCTIFLAGFLALRQWPPAAFGAVMLAVAVAMLIQARHRFDELVQRRRELEGR